jgi:sulfur carrier protein
VKLQVNGDPLEAPDGATIADLLAQLDIRVKHVAVERNRQVVPRAEHPTTSLVEGDELEVVTLVGGG